MSESILNGAPAIVALQLSVSKYALVFGVIRANSPESIFDSYMARNPTGVYKCCILRILQLYRVMHRVRSSLGLRANASSSLLSSSIVLFEVKSWSRYSTVWLMVRLLLLHSMNPFWLLLKVSFET